MNSDHVAENEKLIRHTHSKGALGSRKHGSLILNSLVRRKRSEQTSVTSFLDLQNLKFG